MALKYAAETIGELDGAQPPQAMDGRVVNAFLHRIRATITMAADATTDQYVLAELPANSAFAFGIIDTDTSLGSAVAAIGTSATHGSNGQYRGAATFTAVDTPTLFGKAAAVGAAPASARTKVYLTWATAALPASGTLVIDIYYSKVG